MSSCMLYLLKRFAQAICSSDWNTMSNNNASGSQGKASEKAHAQSLCGAVQKLQQHCFYDYYRLIITILSFRSRGLPILFFWILWWPSTKTSD